MSIIIEIIPRARRITPRKHRHYKIRDLQYYRVKQFMRTEAIVKYSHSLPLFQLYSMSSIVVVPKSHFMSTDCISFFKISPSEFVQKSTMFRRALPDNMACLDALFIASPHTVILLIWKRMFDKKTHFNITH